MRFQLLMILSFGVISAFQTSAAEAADVNDFVDFSTDLLPGRLYVPPAAADPSAARPLILFLHGAGETGSDNVSQVNSNINNLLDAAKQRGAFLYAPQAISYGWVDVDRVSSVMTMIDQAFAEQNADPSRLYVTGLSMGGGGTWNVLNRFADRIAAVVPIAGTNPASDYDPANLVDKRIWAFHARNDGVVTKNSSRNVINGVLAAAGEPTLTFPPDDDTSTVFEFADDSLTLNYTEWPTGGHGIWGRVYRTTDMYDWMFSQTVGLVPGEALHVTRTPYAIYTVKDNDSDAPFDGLGDKATNSKSKAAAAVGEQDTQESGAMVRLAAKFWLPQMPEATRFLESATLRFFLEEITGTPAGPVSLFHSVLDNDLNALPPTDYENPDYTDTLLDVVGPAGEVGRYYELDVTDLVRADYAADSKNSVTAFRLQVSAAAFFEDDLSHRYRFTMPGAEANPPELVLTFIPEPSTGVLAAFGLIGLFALCWRRAS